MQRVADLFNRFRRDERGVFAVFFAMIAIVLIAAAGAVVDFTRVQQARTRAQIAVDGAALALQSKLGQPGVTATTLKADAQALLTERMGDNSVTAVVEAATPDVDEGKLTISGYISVPTYFVALVGIHDIRSAVLSQVTRQSRNLEVSLSIDITGSMRPTGCNWNGQNCTTDKIGDLIDASNMLIELLVSDTQTPTYSKMAIVPWSYSVNVGSLANQVRGTPTPGVTISALTWFEGTSKNISGITRADPGVITLTSGSGTSGLANNDWVYISGVIGMTQINGRIGQVANLNTTSRTFRLKVGSSNLCTLNSTCGTWNSYSSGGTVRKCLLANCLERVTTSGAHGIAAGDSVYIRDTVGTSNINNNVPNVGSFNVNFDWSDYTFSESLWTPNVLTTTTYSLPGTSPSNGIRTSGGTSYCVKLGCSRYHFTDGVTYVDNMYRQRLWQPNNCATDRTANTYTDAAPSTTPLGMHYTLGGTACITNQIVPLTSTKATLHAAIGSTDANGDNIKDDYRTRTLQAVGSTAGHLGLAWGWYMVAPNFAYLWPSAAPAPKAYGSDNLVKAVIFMTDGVFNTPYCNGVTAADATTGAPGDDQQINCNSPHGSSKSQAETLCTNIKAGNNIELFVVGFDLASDATTLQFLEDCATDDDHFFRADTGEDLADAFEEIADTLSELRISR
jgi:Flp pilus assembly protein TadG